MKKQYFTMMKLGKFFREISVIVIGVAITLIASYLLSLRSEKRDMALYLNAMQIELEENIKTLEESIAYFQISTEYADYLRANDKENIHKDSIIKYATNFYRIESFMFKTNAFEMFKTSGIMRLVSDKELLLSIWNAYTDIIELKEGFDWHDKIKWDFMKEDFSYYEIYKGISVSSNEKIPMYTYHSIGVPYGLLEGCQETMNLVNEALDKLKNYEAKY